VQRLSRTLLQLNIATRTYHVDADTPWLDLMVPSVTIERYVAHLLKVYGFEAPIEAAFRYTPGLASRVDLRARTRAGLLAHDLVRLGTSASQLAQLPQRFTTFNSVTEALSWMYVVERATLLHPGVHRYLVDRLGEAGYVSSYLTAYNGMASLRWSELGVALDAEATSASVTRQLVLGASQAFCAQREWFHETEALRPTAT
jgi:heme oxygenase